MKKLIATILSVALITAVVVTPTIKVNAPSFKVGSTVRNDNTIRNNTTKQ